MAYHHKRAESNIVMAGILSKDEAVKAVQTGLRRGWLKYPAGYPKILSGIEDPIPSLLADGHGSSRGTFGTRP
jgi:hypothetical protein